MLRAYENNGEAMLNACEAAQEAAFARTVEAVRAQQLKMREALVQQQNALRELITRGVTEPAE